MIGNKRFAHVVPKTRSRFAAENPAQCTNVGKIRVKEMGEGKGVGIVAATEFVAGDLIFQEEPLVCHELFRDAHPETAGMDEVWCCCMCLTSLEGPLQSLAGYVDKELLASIRSLPGQERHCPLPYVVYCPKGCSASYCSVQCRDRDQELGHQLLCFPTAVSSATAANPDPNAVMRPDHPVTMLRAICELLSNHLGLVYLRMIAAAIAKAQKEACDLPTAWEELGYGVFRSHEEEVTDYVISMHTRMTELLREILSVHCDLSSIKGTHAMLSPEFLKHTIDTLNVNQQLVLPVSAFDFYWRSVPDEEEGLPEMAVLNDVFEQLQAKGIVKVRDALGSGLYSLHHCLNHSCRPNAFVSFTERDATLSLFALSHIKAGEEICFDYVGFKDHSVSSEEGKEAATDHLHSHCASYTDRQAVLKRRFYFTCNCERCAEEAPLQQ